jgi:ABC-type lipoprotein export system ATPase subunit/GNAT superfamily N-acetyltransferase
VAVAEAFGLGVNEARRFVVLDCEISIGPHDVVYVTGDSGSGKSVLLRALQEDLKGEVAVLGEVPVARSEPIIETVGATVEQGLELLSRVGLNDAFLFLRTYDQLSDGQKYRYRIAKLIESGAQWWFADEFCSSLDRDTAKIVAFNLQKTARAMGKAVVVATVHQDLEADLQPTVRIHKRFGKEISVSYCTPSHTRSCTLAEEMRIEPGTHWHWRQLEAFHYRSSALPAAVRKIFSLWRGEELCGVIVYGYPPARLGGRAKVLSGVGLRELNAQLSTITRVVVDPKYRSIGLGAHLVRETLPLVDTRYVEMSAVMARYNPFAEKAGMRLVALQGPAKEIVKISETLERLGFDLQLLASGRQVLARLKALEVGDLLALRSAFKGNVSPRLRKEAANVKGVVYAKMAEYDRAVDCADLAKLARLIRSVGALLQVKAYLFWEKPVDKAS